MEYFILITEFLAFCLLSFYMFRLMNNGRYYVYLLYIVLVLALVLLYPKIEKLLGVYNLLYKNYYAIIISISYYIIFLMVIVISLLKKKKRRKDF